MDVVALAIALAAAYQARRPANDRQTYGFVRFEIIAALVNGMLLFGITAIIGLEGVRRFTAPELPQGNVMAWSRVSGSLPTWASVLALLRSSGNDLNVRATLFHVGSDAVGAFAVGVGGVVVLTTHATQIDHSGLIVRGGDHPDRRRARGAGRITRKRAGSGRDSGRARAAT